MQRKQPKLQEEITLQKKIGIIVSPAEYELGLTPENLLEEIEQLRGIVRRKEVKVYLLVSCDQNRTVHPGIKTLINLLVPEDVLARHDCYFFADVAELGRRVQKHLGLHELVVSSAECWPQVLPGTACKIRVYQMPTYGFNHNNFNASMLRRVSSLYSFRSLVSAQTVAA